MNPVERELARIRAEQEGLPDTVAVLIAYMKADPELAWAWHCNIAVPIMDSTGVGHREANLAAARLMDHLFDYDITTHPHWREFGYD